MMSLTIARSTVTTWRSLPASVWLLVVARAVNRLGAFTLPFLSVTLVAEQGASVAQAGYLLAAFGVATIPSRLLGGRLSDRWGPRATIAVGLVGTAVGQLLVAGARSLTEAAVAVVLLGLAFEVYEPPSQSLVADATSPEDRPVAFGLLFAALAAAGMVAGLLAAVLAGIDLRWLFVADAVTCLACAAIVWWRLPARAVAAGRRGGPRDGRGGTRASCCCSGSAPASRPSTSRSPSPCRSRSPNAGCRSPSSASCSRWRRRPWSSPSRCSRFPGGGASTTPPRWRSGSSSWRRGWP